ncbi:MAG: hypothetical protein J6X18_10725 [Bacteroidales bacterium]|nr:hypothetical protein [Bacteroidales bacterium]
MKTNDERKRAFIEKAREVHGDKYDYSEVEYVNNRTPVKIIDKNCPENPVFYQSPTNHLNGQGNPYYRSSRISNTKHMKWEELYERLKASHPGENLEYPEQDVKNFHDKIRIIDHDLRPDGTEYGEYIQEVNAHLKGSGHPQKAIDRSAQNQRYATEEFIRRAKLVHQDDDYNYDSVEYVDARTKVDVFCNKIGADGKPHGYFKATPDNFLQGKGCPKCGNHVSKGEDEIAEFIEWLGLGVERRMRINPKYELDIYVPEKRFAVEFDGLRWHCEARGKDKWYHYNKSKDCQENGVFIIHVFEDEWLFKKEIVKAKIAHALGKDSSDIKIGARECTVSTIGNLACDEFLEKYHIQGKTKSTVRYGAYYEGNLVGVMCFKKENGEGAWELVRFCTDYHYTSISGLASKLLHAFCSENDVQSVKTFLDRRWNFSENGENLYTKMGFVLDAVEKPDYYYTNGHGERKHKFGFRKHILNRKYGFSMDMTEREMTEQLGYSKIWNCGFLRYVYKPKN